MLAAAALLYWAVNPADVTWLPQCPLFQWTGVKCPFCGAQRMAHALLHLDLREAYSQNAVLLVSLPYCAALLAMRYVVSMPRAYALLTSRTAIALYIIIYIVWMVLRNFLAFPCEV